MGTNNKILKGNIENLPSNIFNNIKIGDIIEIWYSNNFDNLPEVIVLKGKNHYKIFYDFEFPRLFTDGNLVEEYVLSLQRNYKDNN